MQELYLVLIEKLVFLSLIRYTYELFIKNVRIINKDGDIHYSTEDLHESLKELTECSSHHKFRLALRHNNCRVEEFAGFGYGLRADDLASYFLKLSENSVGTIWEKRLNEAIHSLAYPDKPTTEKPKLINPLLDDIHQPKAEAIKPLKRPLIDRISTKILDLEQFIKGRAFIFILALTTLILQAAHFAYGEHLVSPFKSYPIISYTIAILIGLCFEVVALIMRMNQKTDKGGGAWLVGFALIAFVVNLLVYRVWEGDWPEIMLKVIVSLALPFAIGSFSQIYLEMLKNEKV